MILKESHWRGQLHGAGSTTNSRFMRPFCELVSSSEYYSPRAIFFTDDTFIEDPKDVELVPQNLVLFVSSLLFWAHFFSSINVRNKMPYLHWETTRNRERFAGLIDDIVYEKARQKEKEEKAAKRKRQQDRQGLKPPTMPVPNSKQQSSLIFTKLAGFFKQSSVSGGRNANRVSQENANSSRFNISNAVSNDDAKHLRVRGRAYTSGAITRLMLEYRKSPFEIDKNGRVKVAHPLGQYLIDAARLYEGIVSYRDKKLLDQYLMSNSPLHPRRTLDQAYYWQGLRSLCS